MSENIEEIDPNVIQESLGEQRLKPVIEPRVKSNFTVADTPPYASEVIEEIDYEEKLESILKEIFGDSEIDESELDIKSKESQEINSTSTPLRSSEGKISFRKNFNLNKTYVIYRVDVSTIRVFTSI